MTPTRNKIYLSVPGSIERLALADVKIKRENMKLVSKTRQAVITETFEIELTAGNTVFVKDYLDEKGKVIDTEFRDENGRDLSDDPGLFDAIIEFLEELEQ
jgi:hypothetical protein